MDFDGLIVDTEAVWYRIFREWFHRYKDYDLTVQEFLSCVGSDSDMLFEKLAGHGICIDREKFARDTHECFIRKSSELPLKKGVREFLEAAKGCGLLVALATSAGREKISYHFKRLGLLQYFDAIVTSEDVTDIKPAPDLFVRAAQVLQVLPEECLVAEDSVNGLEAGISAGMRVMIIPNEITAYSVFEGQYLTFSSLADVDVSSIIRDF